MKKIVQPIRRCHRRHAEHPGEQDRNDNSGKPHKLTPSKQSKKAMHLVGKLRPRPINEILWKTFTRAIHQRGIITLPGTYTAGAGSRLPVAGGTLEPRSHTITPSLVKIYTEIVLVIEILAISSTISVLTLSHSERNHMSFPEICGKAIRFGAAVLSCLAVCAGLVNGQAAPGLKVVIVQGEGAR